MGCRTTDALRNLLARCESLGWPEPNAWLEEARSALAERGVNCGCGFRCGHDKMEAGHGDTATRYDVRCGGCKRTVRTTGTEPYQSATCRDCRK